MSFPATLTADLIDLELGPLAPELRERTRAYVLERIAGSGQVTRAGLRAAATVIGAAVVARTGSRYERLPDERRRAIARRLARTALPPAAEYVRAVRSLAIAYAFEARYASAP